MLVTDYHAQYYAKELSQTGGDGINRLGRALFDACVDLNPHQIEAALFSLRSPLSKGVLLADEVGLGKTIEAGLVLCQYWAERRQKLLVICPASLRQQWAVELANKFNLNAQILDAKIFKELQKKGIANPFNNGQIVICSMHFIANQAERVKEISWDMVVIDEAHKLRNVYRASNRLGQQIRWATEDRKKLLLTATPLQNSLLELYGLSTLIDGRLFGELGAFRAQYVHNEGDLVGLRERLDNFCWRTLRSQVLEYVPYTDRLLMTRPFTPTEQEHRLYEAVSNYLQQEDCYALPTGQRHLLILLVRKVLASSPQALVGTLVMMRDRLLKMRENINANATIVEKILWEQPLDDELLDEILADQEEELIDSEDSEEQDQEIGQVPPIDLPKLNAEIEILEDYIRWANAIGVDSKSKALIQALAIGFSKMQEMGANQKAVIFTESRRTQDWLKNFLEGNGYLGQVLTFNGSNQDELTQTIYRQWLDHNQGTEKITGSKAIDLRSALISHFESDAQILIATEAGAEGLNLQFCSLVINFDLPWNPQRIEQRIGRCHRYGQKHDVVVINFLNERNEADRRVHQLLEQKFHLFTGVFGASDDILGTIESGLDFERRVLEIYQQCRQPEAIQQAFEELQRQLDAQIQTKMQETRELLMEHFDEDVHDRLRVNLTGTEEKLDRIGRLFWSLSKHTLGEKAVFNDGQLTFELLSSPLETVKEGIYSLISKKRENPSGEYLYRLSHPLGEYAIATAQGYACPLAEVVFDISQHPTRISVIDQLKGKAGWLKLQQLRVDSFGQEDYLLFSAIADEGHNLDQSTCEKLFNCGGQSLPLAEIPDQIVQRLKADSDRHIRAKIAENLETNNRHFAEARDQLDKWAEDMEVLTQKQLDDTKRQIRDLQRRSRQAPTLEEQHQLLEEIKKLETKKRSLRQKMFDTEDEIAVKRDRLVEELEKRMQQKVKITELFTIRWRVV